MHTFSRSSSRTIPWSSGTATSVTPDLFILSSSVGTASYIAAVHARRMPEKKAHIDAPLAVPLTILGLAGPEPHAGETRNKSCQLLVLVNVGDPSRGRLRASLWKTPLKQYLHPFVLVQFWPLLLFSLIFCSAQYYPLMVALGHTCEFTPTLSPTVPVPCGQKSRLPKECRADMPLQRRSMQKARRFSLQHWPQHLRHH